MATPGPTDRAYAIDDSAGAAQTWDPILVGEPTGIGSLDEAIHELTGPCDEWPRKKPAGFTRPDDLVFTFEADVGGATPADPTTEFMVTNRTTARTITITYAAGWTAEGEAYISKVAPKTSPEQLSLLEVTFTPTGTWTIT